MKRDLDLIRELLLQLEAAPACSWPELDELSATLERDTETVREHLLMLLDSGMLAGTLAEADNYGDYPIAQRLTWQGHEFLALSRQTVWDKVKKRMADRALDLPFDAVLALLKAANPLPTEILQGLPAPLHTPPSSLSRGQRS